MRTSRRGASIVAALCALLAPATTVHAARIEVFFETGCPECAWFEREIAPRVAALMPEGAALIRRDIGEMENYLRLVEYQERLNIPGNSPICVVLDGREAFADRDAIGRRLLDRLREESTRPQDATVEDFDEERARSLLNARFARFTPAGIIVAGMIDSANPCAISVLVFFLSALSVAGVRGRRLVPLGAAFIFASFATYFLLGLGAFRVLRALAAFDLGRRALAWVMAGVLATLAVLSLRDAYEFRRTGRSDAVRLQLPERWKTRVRDAIRRVLRGGRLTLGAAAIGVTVTVIESACTGQVYLPTLAWLARGDGSGARVWGYLALYNAMFVLPLIVVFVLVAAGLSTPALLRWSRRNVVPAKLLMAAFFAALAALMLIA